jgi:hypothetical protein
MYKLFFAGLLAVSLVACGDKAGQPSGTEAEAVDTASTATTEMAPVEFLDAKYIEMGKRFTANFTSENVDALVASYTDDARYYWSGGDSIVGKEAIAGYWKDRFANVLESVTALNQVWLPVKVNQPQSVESAGNWLLGWIQFTAKYQSGKEITFWVHQDHHLNANDMIDQTITYVDRVPIQAASAK